MFYTEEKCPENPFKLINAVPPVVVALNCQDLIEMMNNVCHEGKQELTSAVFTVRWFHLDGAVHLEKVF